MADPLEQARVSCRSDGQDVGEERRDGYQLPDPTTVTLCFLP